MYCTCTLSRFPSGLGKSLGSRGCTTQYIPTLGSVRIQYFHDDNERMGWTSPPTSRFPLGLPTDFPWAAMPSRNLFVVDDVQPKIFLLLAVYKYNPSLVLEEHGFWSFPSNAVEFRRNKISRSEFNYALFRNQRGYDVRRHISGTFCCNAPLNTSVLIFIGTQACIPNAFVSTFLDGQGFTIWGLLTIYMLPNNFMHCAGCLKGTFWHHWSVDILLL